MKNYSFGDIQQAVDKLNSEVKKIIELRFIYGCTVREISAKAGISYRQVWKTLHSLPLIFQNLKNELEAYDGTKNEKRTL